MTAEEVEVLELLAEAAVKFLALKPEHPSDKADFVNAIHAAQNVTLARAGLRDVARMQPTRAGKLKLKKDEQ